VLLTCFDAETVDAETERRKVIQHLVDEFFIFLSYISCCAVSPLRFTTGCECGDRLVMEEWSTFLT
jgi:hypothetical protein